MPEGDTIHRTAATLRRVLVGQEVVRFDTPRLAASGPAPGTPILAVEARGKHLLMRFGDGLTLHTHQRMTGSWHVYRPGERWRRGRSGARAIVEVAAAVAVCFLAPDVELLDDAAMARHPVLRRLGPDLCAPTADLDEAARRLQQLDASTPVADALLDQRVACGVGNVYKSEVCFLHGVHPATPVGALSSEVVRGLVTTASALLRRNLDTARRTTVDGGPTGTLWVYGRAGKPCRRCDTPVVSGPLGANGRTTSWCPRCQPPPGNRRPQDAHGPELEGG